MNYGKTEHIPNFHAEGHISLLEVARFPPMAPAAFCRITWATGQRLRLRLRLRGGNRTISAIQILTTEHLEYVYEDPIRKFLSVGILRFEFERMVYFLTAFISEVHLTPKIKIKYLIYSHLPPAASWANANALAWLSSSMAMAMYAPAMASIVPTAIIIGSMMASRRVCI